MGRTGSDTAAGLGHEDCITGREGPGVPAESKYPVSEMPTTSVFLVPETVRLVRRYRQARAAESHGRLDQAGTELRILGMYLQRGIRIRIDAG